MECNKLFYTDQYGFRPGHSTELAAARFVNKLVVDLDNYKIPTSVLIDTIFDNCIISNQYDSLFTNDLQFAYKKLLKFIV